MKNPHPYMEEVMMNIIALIEAGFTLTKVDYERGWGEGEGVEVVTSTDAATIAEAICAVDESHLYIETPSGCEAWVFFVLGNDRGEAVNDWFTPDPAEASDLNQAFSSVQDKLAQVSR